jgi:ribosomal-protein-alanine N-acetyltransferase
LAVDLTSIRYELLKEAHIPKILEIEKESNSAPWSEKSFRNELDNGQSVFVVAILGSNIVGYAGLWLCIDEAHITTIAVGPDFRQQGVGKALMIQLLRRAQDSDIACSTLEVRSGNEAAIHLYKELGYVEAARRKGYYPDNKEDAIVMWLHNLQDWTPSA